MDRHDIIGYRSENMHVLPAAYSNVASDKRIKLFNVSADGTPPA